LRWELLCDPETKEPLATSEKTLLSRFMLSRDWRPVRLQRRSELTALVAVAAPSDLEKYKLAKVDAAAEVARVRSALAGIAVSVAGLDEPLTFELLSERLRAGVDVVYLVCHGMLKRDTGQPFLFLQDESGKVDRVGGADLARRVKEMPQPPRLAVLASCESALSPANGDGKGRTVQASLAPRLAAAGVPAILAMQGQISVATVEKAMPVFFRELLKDGQIDRALAVARGRVRERHDSWMPALYLRLKGGRIWYEPGFAGEDDQFKKWKSIVDSVRRRNFVPIVGPDVGEAIQGLKRELAEHLAGVHGFPMAPAQRTDLAKVAQYLTVRESRKLAHDEILEGLRTQIVKRHPDLGTTGGLKSLFKAVASRRRDDESDPFRILASLKGSVYVNAGWDPLLPLALSEAGARPKLLHGEWRKTKDQHPREPLYKGMPTAENPVVYYILGFLGQSDTLVLTEDDYVDYLIAATSYNLVPWVVRGTLVKSSLLFLGFPLDDWAFRVIFRLIMSLEGSAQLSDYAHVGVQLDPAEHELADVERAREYLQEYFGTSRDAPRIDIYWGSAADFLNELRKQLERTSDESAPAAYAEDEDLDDWTRFD